MIKQYFLLAARTFLRNKVSFIINLIGMAIALGCCITAYVNYEFNVGFDKQQKNVSDIYRVSFIQQSDGKETPYGVCPIPMGELLRENYKEIDQVIRYISKDGQFKIGDEVFRKEFVYADPDFTNLFTLNLLSGSLDLSDKTKILISDKLAKTYFGSADVVGKELNQIVSGQPRYFTVGGVYEAFPFNSSFRFDLLTTFDNYFIDPAQKLEISQDWKRWSTTFVSITNASVISRIEKQLQQYVKIQNDARQDLQVNRFYIEPFIGMATRASRDKNQGHWFNQPMPAAAVIAPFFMAGLLLLVACFNFTNNAIAVAGKRLKEIGIRKTVGGKRKELVLQFFAETFFFSVVAMFMALFLAEYLVAGWDQLWPGIELSVQYKNNLPFISALIALVLITSLLAGSYPALYISSFKPIQVLRDKVKFGNTNLFTKSLLIFQFSISLAAVIFAIAFYFNSKFQKEFDLGFSYQSVVQVPVESGTQFEQLKNALSTNSLIKSIGGAEHHVYSNAYNAPAKAENQVEKEIDVLNIGDDYFKTVNIRILQGRSFEKDRASDFNESLIVNEEFIRVFNLTEPIGKRITLNDTAQFYIVGVVKDVYLGALFEPLSAVAFRYTAPENYRYLIATSEISQVNQLNQQIKAEWKKLFPSILYNGRLMEERMVMAMEHFDNVVVLYTFLGTVAIIMSVSGLFALVSLNLQKRTKELGVRKIMGAPLSAILLQASKLFMVIMAISFLVGSLLGSFLVNKLMDNIWEYYVAIDFKVISLGVLILFTIALATIFLKIFKVAKANPADSLKHE